MSHKFLISFALLALAGCQKPEDAKTQQAQTPVIEGQNSALKEAEKPELAHNFCDDLKLRPEDRAKWDCVPNSGYWCTDPKGCPVNGNLAKIGTRLNSAEPFPKGLGYETRSSCNHCKDWDWQCVREEGCLCGSERIKKNAICYGDVYKAEDALTGSCNKENCQAYCHEGKCVCGESPYDPEQGYRCLVNWCSLVKACQDVREGADHFPLTLKDCEELGEDEDLFQEIPESCFVEYEFEDDPLFTSQYDGTDQFLLRCLSEDGCKCGEKQCKKDDFCINPNPSDDFPSFCEDLDDRESFSKRYLWTIYDYIENKLCDREEGCPCGAQLCPMKSNCLDGLCIYHEEYEHEDSGMIEYHHAFYCDKEEGCDCESGEYDSESGAEICPKGAFCHLISKGETAEVECFTIPKKFKDAKDLFSFNIKDYFYSSRDEKSLKVIFDEFYEDDQDFGSHGHYIEKKKGRTRYIVASRTDQLCNSYPIEEGYLCVKQEIVLGKEHLKNWPYKENGHCRIPFEGSSRDSCRIKKDVIEQVCNLEKGCLCGSKKIQKGKACVDDKGQCSPLDDSPGCLCGGQKIKSHYGCDEGQLICQAGIQNDEKSCLCRNQEIYAGDLCLKDRIICGENSTTKGCLCGEKTLRDGYRCLQKEQICACNEDQDQPCECACGDQKIPKDAICRDDDTALIPRYAQYLAKEDAYLVSCDGQEKKIKRPGYDIAKTENDSIGLYSEEMFCTCGTGKPSPGKDYGCAYQAVKVGSKDAQMIVAQFAGYQCQNFEGCACGDDHCEPGDLCVTESDGSLSCDEYNTFTGECHHHILPASILKGNGYACYHSNEGPHIDGWYCDRPEGCACGDAQCKRGYLCMAPGICSKHPRAEGQWRNEGGPRIIDLKEPD